MESSAIKDLVTGVRQSLRAEVSGRLDAVLSPGSRESLEHPEAVKDIARDVESSGRDKVVDRAAYTWFNRLCALRFMDANGYTTTPVVTPRPGSTQPAILADASQGVYDPEYTISPEVKDRVTGLLSGAVASANAQEEAYAELLSAVCDRYSRPMPYLFKEEVASSLLMPQGLLSEGSILGKIVSQLDDEACGSVEVLGWLYQYYIAERKDEVFASFKKKMKAGPSEIAPATQLFTPDWIVKYMAENSLGRLWMLNNPGSDIRSGMEYYIEPEEGCGHIEVDQAMDIKVLDPACGSGHILVYAFDLLFKMYEEEGWPPEDIPAMILQNNLFGLEIDQRAAEIACFALEMKAREKDPSFFDREIDANVTVLEPVSLDEGEFSLVPKLSTKVGLLDAMAHLGEVGSLYVPDPSDIVVLEGELSRLESKSDLFADAVRSKLLHMLRMCKALSGKYECVIANPPYMTNKNMSSWLSKWLAKPYQNEKADLCTCFIARCLNFCHKHGFIAEITMQSWMFESTYEKLRVSLLSNHRLLSLMHLGIKAFKEIGNDVVQTCSFVFENEGTPAIARFIKLDDCKDYSLKSIEFSNADRSYEVDINNIEAIPGMPLTAYWAPSQLLRAWEEYSCIEQYGIYTGSQNVTGDNDTYLRFHWEVKKDTIKPGYWVPYAKGGNFRRYYGNLLHVVDWRPSAQHFYNTNKSSNLLAKELWYREGITYSAVTSRGTGFRYLPEGCVFDKGGASIITTSNMENLLGLLNSKVATALFSVLNPSVNLQVRDIKALPVRIPHDDTVKDSVLRLIALAKRDWDRQEISQDFAIDPLVSHKDAGLVEHAFALLESEIKAERNEAISLLQTVDCEYCSIYSIDQSLLPEYEERDIPVKEKDELECIKALLSYAVGCMFGRYSSKTNGIVISDSRSSAEAIARLSYDASFIPDEDNIIPVLDGEWFEDDIVYSFMSWLSSVFGEANLDANVSYIEKVLGESIRDYFVKHFYDDHLKLYQKRPIYWMFQSPKEGFSALIYIHRYNEGLVGDLLTKYVRSYQEKLAARIALLEKSTRAKDAKDCGVFKMRLEELTKWEKDIVYDLAHARVDIDLDDGVKHNYNLFPHAVKWVDRLSEWKA